jgi:hypothetical protein
LAQTSFAVREQQHGGDFWLGRFVSGYFLI